MRGEGGEGGGVGVRLYILTRGWRRDNDTVAIQIRVIVAIEPRDVEDLLVVTHFKARESVGYDVVFTLNIYKFRTKLFYYYASAHCAFFIKTL